MPKPLPPQAHGPLTPSSKSVQVTGVLPGATVQIWENTIGQATYHEVGNGPANAEGWVHLTGALQVGQEVSVQQTLAGAPSDISPPAYAVWVINPPNPLPVPVFISPLTDEMDLLVLDSVFPRRPDPSCADSWRAFKRSGPECANFRNRG